MHATLARGALDGAEPMPVQVLSEPAHTMSAVTDRLIVRGAREHNLQQHLASTCREMP